MNVGESPLRNDILAIVTKYTKRDTAFIIDIHTHYGKLEVRDIVSLDISRDYVANLADMLVVKTRMFLGDYTKYILDSKDLMIGTIVWKRGDKTYVRKYRCVLQADANGQINQEQFSNTSIAQLNRESLIEVSFEFTEVEVEPLLIVKADPGVYKGKGKGLLQSILSKTVEKIKINDTTPLDFISVIDPNIDMPLDEVVIKSNTLLQSLPDYVNNIIGLYTSGIGTYVQRTILDEEDKIGLYCYPLWNTYRFREKGYKLAIVVGNTIDLESLKTTYFMDDQTVRLVVTNITKQNDKRNSTDVGTYAGIVDSQETYGIDRTDGSSVTIDKKERSHMFKNQEREDGIDIIETRQIDRHKSVPELMGELSSGFGYNVVYKWSNSDPNLLYPGMPVAVLFTEMGEPVSKIGVLIGNHTVYTPIESPDGVKYVATTVLMVKLTDEKVR